MSRARRYPPANITAQWWEDNFSRGTMATIDKLLLHTTETSSWPAYDAGAKAPTVTYNPWVPAGQRWRQHNWLNTSARALQDPSSTPVRENRDNVVQVEIIAYCNPASYAKYGHGVNELPDSAYEDLGAFLAFLHTEWSVPLVRAPKWETYPPSNDIRMSSATYDAFKGVLGHQHASGNDHGDPGMTNAQVDRILAVANRITAGTSGSTPKPPTQATTEPKEGDLDVSQYDDIMNAIKAAETNNSNRYSDLKKRIDALTNAEAGRYQYYHDAFGAVLRAVAADDANDVTEADVDRILAKIEELKSAEPEAPKA